MVLWKRGIMRGITAMKRERHWLAAFGALAGVLTLLQLLVFGSLAIQSMQSAVRDRADLRLEILQDASDQQIREFTAALQQMEQVKEIQFITKEQSYERAKTRDGELVAFLEKFGMDNPFPDTVSVTLRSLSDYDAFAEYIQQEQWKKVVDPTFLTKATDQEAQAHELLSLTRAGGSLTGLFLVIAGGVLTFIVTELVRRRAQDRGEEVLIERLVGAHPLTVFLPFATEATILLWIATVVSAVALILLLTILPLFVPAFQPSGLLAAIGENLTLSARSTLPILFAVELLLAPLLAGLGAYLGIRPQLNALPLSLSAL